jgi:hypothetical protein
MEQIAVKAWRFKVLPSDPLPNFEAIYFIDSEGKFSVNSEFFHADQAKMGWWEYTTNTAGKKWISFWCGGESFDITDEDQDSIARPFFQKHLMNLMRD